MIYIPKKKEIPVPEWTDAGISFIREQTSRT